MDCNTSKHYSTILVGVVCFLALGWGRPAHAIDDLLPASAPPGLIEWPVQTARIQSVQASGSPICGEADFAHQVVELSNIERFENGGLPPLKAVNSLLEATHSHSVNMAERNFFAHCDLDTKKSPWQRMRDAGYYYYLNFAAENIATGQQTPAAVVNSWMNSYGHRMNILDPSFREVGAGYYFYSGDTPNTRKDTNSDCVADNSIGFSTYRYWTQNFGLRSGVYPVVINLEAHWTDSRNVDLYIYGAGWASQMRLRNNDGSWTPWMAFQSEMSWTLDPLSGPQTVTVEIRSSSGSVRAASDEICVDSDDPVQLPELIFEDGLE
jgi:uncharacterized protein YkwD